MSENGKQRVAIIGGGISGLAAAQRLSSQHPGLDVWLLEAGSRLGGVIQTTEDQGFFFEHSADSFIVSPELPWAGDLCEQVNLELQATSVKHRGAQIVKRGRLFSVPEGLQLMTLHRFDSILRSPLLSWHGKLRVFGERFIGRGNPNVEESLEQFAIRRYGREMFEWVIQPLVAGIYTADPKRLSMNAALRQFVTREQKEGSLWAGRQQNIGHESSQGARYGLFRAPTHGMQQLINAIESQLTNVRVCKNASVNQIRVDDNGKYELTTPLSELPKNFDGVIVATPVRALPRLMEAMAPDMAAAASQVESVDTAVIALGLHRKQFRQLPQAFGFVVPWVEKRRVLAVSFSSVKFPNRAPQDHMLLRVFVGGALQPEMLQHDDLELVQVAMEELGELLGVTGSPLTHRVFRWRETTPQYNLGHRKRVEILRLGEANFPAFAIAGNAYDGIGIPQCVRGGWAAADRVAGNLLVG